MERDFFGTDGIRGRVGAAPITPDFCLRLGWATGKVLASAGSRMVVIGKDTRISGYMIESVLEAGLVSAGVDVRLLSPVPTPAVAYLTRRWARTPASSSAPPTIPTTTTASSSSTRAATSCRMIAKRPSKSSCASRWCAWAPRIWSRLPRDDAAVAISSSARARWTEA